MADAARRFQLMALSRHSWNVPLFFASSFLALRLASIGGSAITALTACVEMSAPVAWPSLTGALVLRRKGVTRGAG